MATFEYCTADGVRVVSDQRFTGRYRPQGSMITRFESRNHTYHVKMYVLCEEALCCEAGANLPHDLFTFINTFKKFRVDYITQDPAHALVLEREPQI